MSFEEEFDSIIRRKSEELDFPFDEKNWDKASALLDAEYKVAVPKAGLKRFLIPSIIAGVIVISGIAVVLSTLQQAVVPAENKGPVAQAGTAPNAIVATEKNANETNTTPSTSSSSENLSTNISSNKKSTTVAENAATSAVKAAEKNTARTVNTSEANTVATVTKNNSAKTTSNKDKSTVSAVPAKNNNAPEAVVVSKVNNNPETKTVAKDEAASNASPVSSDKQNKVVEDTNTPAVNGNETTGSQQNTTNPIESSVATANVTPQDESATPAQTPATTLNEQPLTNIANESEAVQYLPLVFVTLPSQTEPEIAETPLNHINRYDEDYFNNGKHKLHFANVELGATYLLGWDTQAGKDGKGLDWFGGFNYGLYLTKKISVSAGMQAYNIKNITQAFYSNKTVNYDFGSVISNTIITSNNLYYAAVPVKIGYELNKTSQFNVGANFGYLIASKNTVETYQVQDNVKMHNKNVKNTNVYQNANSMNIMLTAAYKVEVMRRLNLNTEFVYGISDIFKNTKTIKNNEQAIGIRLSLQYTLFDK